ncbi:MAG: FAD-dependent oxidoreductase [Treponema sp.]|jgi:thioredoxin reductase (NADPH)|nr:FAD-dependent oxidoreductase [Treponema sp.]
MTDFDLIIIGAGPAGLTAAQYGARANLRVLVLEKMAPGGQALLIDALENYPGNTGADGKPKTGFEFSQDLYRQAGESGARFLTEEASSLEKEGGLFRIGLGNGETKSCLAVILAAGAEHRKLGIPGEDRLFGRGVSYCAACDGPFFKGKRIFVAGGGDAACDEAQYLSRLTEEVILVHRRSRFRAQKALADRALHNPNIRVRFNTALREIRGEQKVSSVVLEKTGPDGKGLGETGEEAADAVFIFAGMVPQTGLVPGIDKDGAGYILTGGTMVTSQPGLYAAGDIRSGAFRQVVTACGDGAMAAHSAAAYIDELRGESYR